MINGEIKNLIETIGLEKQNIILTNFIDKSNKLEKEANFIGLGMLILVLLYYLGELKAPGNIQVGILTITDISALNFLIPLVFSFLLLRYVIISSHQAELKNIIKILTKEIFNYDNTDINPVFTDDLTRLLLPVTILEEINKINLKGNIGCTSMLFLLPIGSLLLLPFYLLSSWLYPQISDFNQLDFFQKASTVLTLYIIILTVFYFIKNLYIGVKEAKISS